MNKKFLKLFYIVAVFILVGRTIPVLSAVTANESQVSILPKYDTYSVITTKSDLIHTFINHITNLDRNFSLKISHNVLGNNNKAFSSFWVKLTGYPEYNEIMEYSKITGSTTYNYQDYFIWNITVNYNISKNKAKKLLRSVTPVVNTKEELIRAIRQHVENLEENFYINVNRKVLNMDDKKSYDAFWNELYEIPEFNDVSRYFKNFQSSKNDYHGYYKWIIKTKYKISKKELNYMNGFIKDWIGKNINDKMTDEEKVRAINDFMVAKYRYTFGDKGQCPKGSKNCPDEKLGKYSVYSTFSLLFEGGGVCDAKAKLFYRLAKEAGLEVLYITGYVNRNTLHAWNMVKVDGNWYHIDTTWNRGTEPGMGEYEYFNTRDYYLKSDSSMKKGHHTWKAGKYPKAYSDYPLAEG